MISIIAVLLRVCASSVTIHSIPAASWCAPCMAVMNRWQTKCWLQTLIKQLISLLVNCWDFLNCDQDALGAEWSHLNLRLRQVWISFLFYVLLPLFSESEELIYLLEVMIRVGRSCASRQENICFYMCMQKLSDLSHNSHMSSCWSDCPGQVLSVFQTFYSLPKI